MEKRFKFFFINNGYDMIRNVLNKKGGKFECGTNNIFVILLKLLIIDLYFIFDLIFPSEGSEREEF